MKRSNISVIAALLLGLAAGLSSGCFKGFDAARPSADDLKILNDKPVPPGQEGEVATDPGGNTPADGTTPPEEKSGAETQGPVDVKASEEGSLFTPADRAEGQAFSEVKSATMMEKNDAALAGEKSADASKLVSALTMVAMASNGSVQLSVEAAIFVRSSEGNWERRLLEINNAPVSFSADGNVMPMSVNLRKDINDTEGTEAGDSVIASALCKDANCSSIQVRLEFKANDEGGIVPAVFVMQLADSAGYVLAASNLTTELNALPAFETFVQGEQAAVDKAAVDKAAADQAAADKAAADQAAADQATADQAAADKAAADKAAADQAAADQAAADKAAADKAAADQAAADKAAADAAAAQAAPASTESKADPAKVDDTLSWDSFMKWVKPAPAAPAAAAAPSANAMLNDARAETRLQQVAAMKARQDAAAAAVKPAAPSANAMLNDARKETLLMNQMALKARQEAAAKAAAVKPVPVFKSQWEIQMEARIKAEAEAKRRAAEAARIQKLMDAHDKRGV